MIEVGTILQNRYRIDKQIGQGGMGKVYVANDERFESTVAIKETVFEDKNLRKAFEREARLLNSLKHPALPRVSDHFIEDDGQFLVMEYIAGEDLAEMMERSNEAFALDNVLTWAEQLCEALEYLHSQDIIHRDIKPQNLKLNDKGHIVLLDFGLAKGNAADSPNQTVAKSIFGYSRSYASLEQIQGTGTEPRSDLYSLGATLYHLLTGIPPADALTRAMNVLNGQPDPLIEINFLNEKVPSEVSEILMKTMALNAGERPESAAALWSMLDESDKETFSEAFGVGLAAPFSADFLNQKTRIFGAPTNFQIVAKSTAGTQFLPAQKSGKNSKYKTLLSAQSTVTNVQAPTQSRFKAKSLSIFSAAVFGSLLLIGSFISAAYIFNPYYDLRNNTETAANELTGDFVNPQQELDASTTNSLSAVSTDSAVTNNKAEAKDTKSKKVKTIQNRIGTPKSQSRKSSSVAKQKKIDDDENRILINEESIETGGMIIDENGIRMKPHLPKAPFLNGEFRGFTPVEIDRLKQIINHKKRVLIVKTPEPKN